MDYIEISITNFSGYDPEIVIARMAELGFESFAESESGIQGFIRADLYVEDTVIEYLRKLNQEHGILHAVVKIPSQNWNAMWESSYEPVIIAGRCRIRAPFHHADDRMQYEIVIEPRMSFGTAHHETTSLMLEMLMQEEVRGRRVLDMGCGTGVLAILAKKMEAAQVVAIDNDEWAYSNALDNMEKNDALMVTVIKGEAGDIPLPPYDVVIANINRNVLLNDIPAYAKAMKSPGILLVSGFYVQDLDLIRAAAGRSGFHYAHHKTDNNWVGAKFIK